MNLRTLAKRWLKLVVSAALLAVLLTQLDLRAVQAALANVRWIGVWIALALFIAGVFIRSYRWQILLNALELRVPLRKLTSLYFVGSFFNTVLPTGFGGDVVKAAELAQSSGRGGEAAGTVVMDRVLGIVALLAMGMAALLVAGDWVDRRITWGLGLLSVALLASLWLLRQRWLLSRLSDLIPSRWRAALLAFLRDFYNGLRGYSGRTLLAALAVSVLFNITWVAVNVVLGWSLGIDATLAQYLVFVPLVSLSLLLPSVGGLGVRELTYVGLFGLIGVAEEPAFALGILVYAITFVTGLIGGLIYLVQGVRTARRVQHEPTPSSEH